ncbi:hypothetical protein CRM22_004217 [Opisthorchis felineus]|uniref:SGF29 C-terminal domain-containing protein n=3 Tax=Opisthorchis TaxID=6197 RepID=A0A4S2LXD7_OPIFE|nr:hypothetical protein CRM22_004217 [Opisthorchis felineus]
MGSLTSGQEQLREYTKDFLSLCKKAVKEVSEGRTTLSNLDALRRKQRSSKVNKPQLKSLYAQAIAEAQRQKTSLMNALNKVSQIHQVEHEMRLALGPRNFRRGVLMSVLQENAKSIPMWVGKSGEKAPPLCGSIPASASTTAQAGDQVAALVPEPDVAATAACNLSEGCILAEVVSYDAEKRTYQVEDVDAEEGKVRYTLPRSKVIPLPKWKANPVTNPEAIFPKGTTVFALYPQTTCFYKAVVDEVPLQVHDEYSLYFEDSSYPEGYAPAIRIPQRYVIECREKDCAGGSRRRSKQPSD